MRRRYGFGVLGLLAPAPAALAGEIAFGRAEVRIGTAAGKRRTGARTALSPGGNCARSK